MYTQNDTQNKHSKSPSLQ